MVNLLLGFFPKHGPSNIFILFQSFGQFANNLLIVRHLKLQRTYIRTQTFNLSVLLFNFFG